MADPTQATTPSERDKLVADIRGGLPPDAGTAYAALDVLAAMAAPAFEEPPSPPISGDEREALDSWLRVLGVIKADGEWDLEQARRELADFRLLVDAVPRVYGHVTGWIVSKPLTDPQVVCDLADERNRREVEEMAKDAREVDNADALATARREGAEAEREACAKQLEDVARLKGETGAAWLQSAARWLREGPVLP